MNTMKPRRITRAAFIILMIAILLAFAFITPQGRAFAQSLFRFFSPAKSESFPLSDEQIKIFDTTPTPAPTFELSLATVSPSHSEPVDVTAIPLPTSSNADDVLKNCKAASDMSSYACQIALTELQVGFDAREFPAVPRGFAFVDTRSNSTLHTITINYSVVEGGGYLSLSQGIGAMAASSSNWGDVMASAIEQIRVGDYYGEFVDGNFAVYPGAKSATWVADGGTMRLRWSDGDRWFSLQKMGGSEYLDKNTLIALAASLVYTPASDAITSIDNTYQMSIAEAEAAAGFELLEPTIVPEGFEFAYARYDEIYQTVYLFYLPKGQDKGVGGLLVIETPRSISGDFIHCADCPAGTEEQVQVNGTPAIYFQGSFYTGSNLQPLSTPVWQADDPNYNITWATPELLITLNYYGTEWYGGQISKDDLVQIAESMR